MTAEELLNYFEKLAAMFKPTVTVNVSYTDNRVEKDESTYVDRNFMGGDSNMCECGCPDPECKCVCHWNVPDVGENEECTLPNCTCVCHLEE